MLSHALRFYNSVKRLKPLLILPAYRCKYHHAEPSRIQVSRNGVFVRRPWNSYSMVTCASQLSLLAHLTESTFADFQKPFRIDAS
jgi:hypothetical protein